MKVQLIWIGLSIASVLALVFILSFPFDIMASTGVYLSFSDFVPQIQMRKMWLNARGLSDHFHWHSQRITLDTTV